MFHIKQSLDRAWMFMKCKLHCGPIFLGAL